ncbi:hypothetical protein [Sorangium sp. So ce1000]|uniref:hypothetical protein n=1 Tax=Sorangium sp. So ce1000 TaxID=3133325 RepID=UPI003F5E09CF
MRPETSHPALLKRDRNVHEFTVIRVRDDRVNGIGAEIDRQTKVSARMTSPSGTKQKQSVRSAM